MPAPPRLSAHAPLASSAGVKLIGVIAAGVVIAMLYFGRDVLLPFALAVLLSFLLAPGVRRLRRYIGRVSAVGLMVIVAFVPICALLALLGEELAVLTPHIPEYRLNLERKIDALYEAAPAGNFIRNAVELFQERPKPNPGANPGTTTIGPASQAPPQAVAVPRPNRAPLQDVKAIVEPLAKPLALAGLTVLFVIMILYDWENMRDRVLRLVGGRNLQRTTAAMNDAGRRVSHYLLLQLAVNAGYGVLIFLGLTLIGVPAAPLWGLTSALLRFIPYLGILIAASFPLALAIASAPGWGLFVWTFFLYASLELIVANFVEPRLYGAHTGLSAVAVIAAAAFWTWLWGPIGLLLSTPLTLCLVSVGRHVRQLRFLDIMLGNEAVLAPEERFYQRMLAGDPDEVTHEAETFAHRNSLAEFFDEVAIPGLVLAQADSDRGALSAAGQRLIRNGTVAMLENIEDSEPKPPSPPLAGPSVACIAGRNALDEAAGALFLHLLRRRGRVAIEPPGSMRPLTMEALAPRPPDHPETKEAALLCLSLISADTPTRARYLVRRMRKRVPQARVLLGLWGQPAETAFTEDVLASSSADFVAGSLRDAADRIEAFAIGALPPSGASAAAEERAAGAGKLLQPQQD